MRKLNFNPITLLLSVAALTLTTQAQAERTGADVYGTFCIACHSSGVSGAPKAGNAGDWAPRIAQGKDVLVKHALNGFNAMPPKGTCMNCSTQELTAAIEFMTKGL